MGRSGLVQLTVSVFQRLHQTLLERGDLLGEQDRERAVLGDRDVEGIDTAAQVHDLDQTHAARDAMGKIAPPADDVASPPTGIHSESFR